MHGSRLFYFNTIWQCCGMGDFIKAEKEVGIFNNVPLKKIGGQTWLIIRKCRGALFALWVWSLNKNTVENLFVMIYIFMINYLVGLYKQKHMEFINLGLLCPSPCHKRSYIYHSQQLQLQSTSWIYRHSTLFSVRGFWVRRRLKITINSMCMLSNDKQVTDLMMLTVLQSFFTSWLNPCSLCRSGHLSSTGHVEALFLQLQ